MTDPFFDDVHIECPTCKSREVIVYKYFDADNKDKSEAHCCECHIRWFMM
mgnify:FL=1